jgi:uncharacterized protein (TIGR03032 family)
MEELVTSFEDGFQKALEKANITIGISTYKASRLITICADEEGVVIRPSLIPRAMGIGFEGELMAVASKAGINMYRRFIVGKDSSWSAEYDYVWLERAKYHTGPIDAHDVAVSNKQVFAVNTAWSCISIFGFEDSFKPIWRPPFISGLSPTDRCHLNGMAVRDGKPAYATALGQSNESKGWKTNLLNGGVLMETKNKTILAEGLSLPHSPVYLAESNELWFLQSGEGTVCRFDLEKNCVVPVIETDLFIRGLAIHNQIAFVGFSQLRKTSKLFKPLENRLQGDQCGVLAADLRTGEVLGEMIFGDSVEELYDVSIFPGQGRHLVLSEGDHMHNRFLAMGDRLINIDKGKGSASWPGFG